MPEEYNLTLLHPDGKLGRDISIMRTEIEELHAKLARMPAVIARAALGPSPQGRVDLVAARLTPHDEPDASRSRVAERHRRARLRFHAYLAERPSRLNPAFFGSPSARLRTLRSQLRGLYRLGSQPTFHRTSGAVRPYAVATLRDRILAADRSPDLGSERRAAARRVFWPSKFGIEGAPSCRSVRPCKAGCKVAA
jgi:hypothetical protein